MKLIKWGGVLFFLLLIISACSSDDTPNSNANLNSSQIQTIVLSNTWIITNFNDSGNDETGHFKCFSFRFNSDGTLIATDGTVTHSGTWSVVNSTSGIDFNINFNLTNAFEDLNDDWDVVSVSATNISLIDISGGNGGTDRLTFEVGTPQSNCTSQLQNTIQNNVQMGTWRISFFEDSGTNETHHFLGFIFEFKSNGEVNATNGSTLYIGTWSITDSNGNSDNLNELDFNLKFNLTNDFEDLNGDWDFISASNTVIELIDISGGNGGTDYLTFNR